MYLGLFPHGKGACGKGMGIKMAYKILVIDDDAQLLKMLQRYFEIKNYEIITAKNCAEGLSKMKLQPDILEEMIYQSCLIKRDVVERDPKEKVERLARTMVEAKEHVKYCKECYTLTDQEICPVCSSTKRDHATIMVVENTRDLAAYEKTGKYTGVYHVLHGAISPMLGIGPNDIRLKELMERLEGEIKEVIVATNSSLEGETTAMYIGKLIKPTGIKVTRIASGVQVGGDLEYIDEVTLLRALEGRTVL